MEWEDLAIHSTFPPEICKDPRGVCAAYILDGKKCSTCEYMHVYQLCFLEGQIRRLGGSQGEMSDRTEQ